MSRGDLDQTGTMVTAKTDLSNMFLRIVQRTDFIDENAFAAFFIVVETAEYYMYSFADQVKFVRADSVS